MLDTRPLILKAHTDFPPLRRAALQILQVNLGYVCNLSCTHCHVNAGPNRTESMSEEMVGLVVEACDRLGIKVLDLTGGAPELNPYFHALVLAVTQRGVQVIDRCNLTVLKEPGQENLAAFLAAQGVQVVASLPCYSQENVDKQRGKGVFIDSIEGLKQLNALGYGQEGGGLILDLVYNPGGPFLPPPQAKLEADYKKRLWDDFGIVFNQLLTLANMPISRFGSVLLSKGQFDTYMQLLKDNYAAGNLANVMCRSTLSVDWQGYLYDCDFNQMLNMPLVLDTSITHNERPHLRDVLYQSIQGNDIVVADHCFGCTAGQGSSCGGALN